MRIHRLLFASVPLLLLSAPSARANLIAHPSFETFTGTAVVLGALATPRLRRS